MNPLFSVNDFLSRLSRRMTEWLSSPLAAPACVLLMVIWGAWAWRLHFSDASQLVFSTVTSALSTWLLFVLLHVNGKENRAMHLKLDEIIRSQDNARNDFRRAETATDAVLEELAKDECC